MHAILSFHIVLNPEHNFKIIFILCKLKLQCAFVFQVEYSFPPLVPGGQVHSNEAPLEWKHLPSLAIPDGAHNYTSGTYWLLTIQITVTVYTHCLKAIFFFFKLPLSIILLICIVCMLIQCILTINVLIVNMKILFIFEMCCNVLVNYLPFKLYMFFLSDMI